MIDGFGNWCLLLKYGDFLGGGLKYVLCSSLFGEKIQFD